MSANAEAERGARRGAQPHPLRAPCVAWRSRLIALAKEALSAAVRWSGAAALVRNTYGRRKAAILVYHNPDPEVLERHLRFLSRAANFVTLDEIVDAIGRRDWSGIPPKAVAITVDDGHAGNARLLELFRRYGVVPTIYLCTQIVGTRRAYWWTVDGIDKRRLWALPNRERLGELEREHGFVQTHERGERQALDIDEIRAMRPFVDFQSHTRFHPVLSTCEDDEARVEIERSREEVETLTGASCRHFSYPNGVFGEREVELVKQAGYASARSIRTGWTHVGSDPYALRILGVPDDGSLNLLSAQLAGIKYLRNLMLVV